MKPWLRVIREGSQGVILSTSSPAAVVGGMGPHVYYSATQSFAAELRPRAFGVNAMIPGAIVTEIIADIVVGGPQAIGATREALAATVLLNRPGLPENIVAGAVYLASDEAASSTGGDAADRCRHDQRSRRVGLPVRYRGASYGVGRSTVRAELRLLEPQGFVDQGRYGRRTGRG
jgi:NAD(P)-dependent dehydrogenase (short-subunit alcohol dehydrogenase family)